LRSDRAPAGDARVFDSPSICRSISRGFAPRARAFRLPWTGLMLALIAALAGRSALAQSYTVQDLGTLGGASIAYGVNASGQVVGESGGHAFRYRDGASMVDLGTLGGSESAAFGINSAGQVVGFASTRTGERRPFRLNSTGGMVDL